MAKTKEKATAKAGSGVSNKVKLAVGAAGLLLFIVGVKRTYDMGNGNNAGRPAGEKPQARGG